MDTSSLRKRKDMVTDELQELIEEAIDKKETLIFEPGIYHTGPLFLPSHSHICFEENSVLVASQEEKDYPLIPTRLAGIEMKGYPGILNILNAEDVTLKGPLHLHGEGDKWYRKYWGKDTKGGMRKEYEKRGMRWASDYDCYRPKNILIQNSHNITLDGLCLFSSPFWNLHVLYSNDIKLLNLRIRSDNPNSPSTDGIDIDSSKDILIKGCSISTDDDAISLKSGRDADGLRVGIPTENVTIEDCSFAHGYGLSIGSELSGGISSIAGKNLSFFGSDCGFRIKSSPNRKGYVKNVSLSNISMLDVRYPFYLYLNWNPHYNELTLPSDFKGPIPDHYKKLLEKVDPSLKDTEISHLRFSNIDIRSTPGSNTPTTLFTFCGFPSSPIKDVVFEDMKASVSDYGSFQNCEEPKILSSAIEVTSPYHSKPGSFDNR